MFSGCERVLTSTLRAQRGTADTDQESQFLSSNFTEPCAAYNGWTSWLPKFPRFFGLCFPRLQHRLAVGTLGFRFFFLFIYIGTLSLSCKACQSKTFIFANMALMAVFAKSSGGSFWFFFSHDPMNS